MIERWRPIIGFESLYEVSSHGRIRSIAKNVSTRRWPGATYKVAGRIMSLDASAKKGHLAITLRKNKKYYRHWVHRLVLTAFCGPCPPGKECRHLDGNPANNLLSNLIWGTPIENWNDRRRHGKHIWTPSTNTSGMRGVSFDKRLGKWHAYIGYAPRWNIGMFSSFEEAKIARLKAETQTKAPPV